MTEILQNVERESAQAGRSEICAGAKDRFALIPVCPLQVAGKGGR